MLRELYDEPVELEVADEGVRIGDALDARRVMIALAQAERDLEQQKELRRAVVASYDDRIRQTEQRRQQLRGALQGYLEQGGEAKFPDVGTAYLAKGEPRIEVVDRDVVREHFGAMFERTVFDETAFKAFALKQATEQGEIMDGVEFHPGGPRLTVRPA